jgi:hypothetical protein
MRPPAATTCRSPGEPPRGRKLRGYPNSRRVLELALVISALGGCGRIGFAILSDDDNTGEDATLGCPASYSQTPDGCYRIVATATDWLTAEQSCEADGAHLIVLDDLAEHYLLHSMLMTAGVPSGWLGFTDRRVETVFRWVTVDGLDPASNGCYWGGSPASAGNSPTNNCVIQAAMNACPDWTVLDCAVAQPFVCEHDGTPADPTTY